jgi:hypothetical protein
MKARRKADAADGLLQRVAASPSTRNAGPAMSRAAEELVARGLAEIGADGALSPTEAGRARLRRLREPEHPHLAQHADLERRVIDHDGAPVEMLVDANESPLAWLAKRKDKDGKPLLGAASVQAGERFRVHFMLGQLSPRVTSNWAAPLAGDRRSGQRGGAAELSDAAASARQRVGHALDAVGPELGGILMDVCGFLKGLEQVERERGWPPRTAKIVLGLALERLAAHYGLGDRARGSAGPGRIRTWRAGEGEERGVG